MEVRDTHDGLVLLLLLLRRKRISSPIATTSWIKDIRRATYVFDRIDRSDLSTVAGIYSRTFCRLVAGYFTKPRTAERIFSF